MFQSSLTAKCGIEYFPFRHASLPPQSCRKFYCARDILRELVRCDFGVNLQAFLRLLGGCLYGGRRFAHIRRFAKKSGPLTDGATLVTSLRPNAATSSLLHAAAGNPSIR